MNACLLHFHEDLLVWANEQAEIFEFFLCLPHFAPIMSKQSNILHFLQNYPV